MGWAITGRERRVGCYARFNVKNRRSLTPAQGVTSALGVHAMRRGGARRDVTARVTMNEIDGDLVLEGWALNVSRGGVRVILEETVELGKEFDVTVGDPEKEGTSARGRIVWVQEEPDGVVAGVEFVGHSGLHPSSPPPAMSGDGAGGPDGEAP
jgi:PilZ domain